MVFWQEKKRTKRKKEKKKKEKKKEEKKRNKTKEIKQKRKEERKRERNCENMNKNEDWKGKMAITCQVLQSQLPSEKLDEDLAAGFPINNNEETQGKWMYEYIIAHKLVSKFPFYLARFI